MTYWKTVGAYLTGWLIAQPTFAAIQRFNWRRELENPSDMTVRSRAKVAEAVVDELGVRLPYRCKVLIIDGERSGRETPRGSSMHVARADVAYVREHGELRCIKDRWGTPQSPTVELEFINEIGWAA